MLSNFAIDLLGSRPLLVLECDSRQSEFQFSAKLGLRQVAFYPVSLDAAGVKNQYRGSPGHIKTVEPSRVFLDVRLNRNKIRSNEVRYFIICVRLGFQPSATASSRRCAKVDQQRTTRTLGLGKGCVHIVSVPRKGHMLLLLIHSTPER
jgi:hypothetical protein